MNNKVFVFFTIAILAVAILAGCSGGKPSSMPGTALNPHLNLGMSESQVRALLGRPKVIGVNSKYERKTAEQWKTLQAQADADSGAQSIGSAPSIASLKASAELTHRFHDIWYYQPTPSQMLGLYFDQDKKLAKMAYGPAKNDQTSAKPKGAKH